MNALSPSKIFKIGLITCYFGKAPWYFKLFAKSCAYNPGIDFIIVSDINFSEELPSNVIVVKRTIEQIRKTAFEKLSFEVCLKYSYKFCDFKPAYGLLFSDLLEGYDFWGHADIDVMYGNIREFITDDVLHNHDLISVRSEYISGFFSLFRNNERMCNLFKLSKDYKKVFQDPEDFCFDECNWEWYALVKGKTIFQVKTQIQSMTYIVKKLSFCGALQAFFSTLALEGIPGKIEWNKGELTYDKKQKALLYHFIQFKSLPYFFVPDWKKVPDQLYINENFISAHSPDSIIGKSLKVFFKVWPSIYIFFGNLKQYFLWLMKYIRSSRKPKIDEAPYVKELLGTYKLANYLIVDVVSHNERLFVQSKNVIPISLLHVKNNKFMTGKFEVASDLNIDIEFNYDEFRHAYALCFKPFRNARTILYKV